ncbi:MAG TPA: hypothetical protein VEB67_00515 [Nitrososphaerales archaeon]|nr:hypothetical protein [Nitrososphaerales archaeon]
MKTAKHVEGKTVLIVPAESLKTDPPPTHPAFFNRMASVNRDVAVAIFAARGARTFCDAMAGVGSRGVRVAKEVESAEGAWLVDINREALALARRSAKVNGVLGRCRFEKAEVSSFLHSRFGKGEKFDDVDVDPFGSPARQIPAALSATADGGVLSVTATDTAALCGVYPRVAARRYGGTSVSNSFHHETGVRILLYALAREGAAQELGVVPVFAHATRHYIRATVEVRVGATRADESLSMAGYVDWCPLCKEVWTSKEPERRCTSCGGKAKAAGPLWAGKVADEELLGRVREDSAAMGLEEAGKLATGLSGVDGFPPWSFDMDEACSSLGIATVPEAEVRERLERNGFRTMRQPFETRGVKTDAPWKEFVDAVKESAGRKRLSDP